MLHNDKVIVPHSDVIEPLLREHDKVMRLFHSFDKVKEGEFAGPMMKSMWMKNVFSSQSSIREHTSLQRRRKKRRSHTGNASTRVTS